MSKHRKRNRNHRRENLWKRYRITIEQFELMLEKQKLKCAVCYCDDPGKLGWNVDHCHTTGKIRGILCAQCNFSLGRLKDNPIIALSAAVYLFTATQGD